MTAFNSNGFPVALDGANTFFLEGGASGIVTNITYNPVGHVMTVYLDGGQVYNIPDTNPFQFKYFMFVCGLSSNKVITGG